MRIDPLAAEAKRDRFNKPRPAPQTEGLSPLDQDRAASVADEGGAAGAAVETQDGETSSAQAPEPSSNQAHEDTEERKAACDADDRVSHSR